MVPSPSLEGFQPPQDNALSPGVTPWLSLLWQGSDWRPPGVPAGPNCPAVLRSSRQAAVTGAKNQRRAEVGSDLWRVMGPTPCSDQANFPQRSSWHRLVSSEYLQWHRQKQGLNKLHCESTGVQGFKGGPGFTSETVGAPTYESQRETFRYQEYASTGSSTRVKINGSISFT